MDLETVILSEGIQRRRNIVRHPLYVESKKKWYNWTDKTLTDSQTCEFMAVWRCGWAGRGGEWVVREFGTDMCTLLYFKWKTDKVLLNSMWNSTQCDVAAWRGGEFGGEYILVSEKATAPYSSTLAWKIPWMEEPGRLQSMGSLRIRHDWATSLSLFIFLHWRRTWQPTPVILPGESQGRGAWWAAFYGVAQSQTRLKRLSSSSSLLVYVWPSLSAVYLKLNWLRSSTN